MKSRILYLHFYPSCYNKSGTGIIILKIFGKIATIGDKTVSKYRTQQHG